MRCATSQLWVRLLVAPNAARSLGGEEATTSVLAPTVSFLLLANSAAHTVQDTRYEKTSHRSPHEGERFDTEFGFLAVRIEIVTALDENGAVCDISELI